MPKFYARKLINVYIQTNFDYQTNIYIYPLSVNDLVLATSDVEANKMNMILWQKYMLVYRFALQACAVWPGSWSRNQFALILGTIFDQKLELSSFSQENMMMIFQ